MSPLAKIVATWAVSAVVLEAQKDQCACVCWVLPAPVVVSAIEEVPFGVEGCGNKVESSCAKDDMGIFGCGERSGASCNCDSAAG